MILTPADEDSFTYVLDSSEKFSDSECDKCNAKANTELAETIDLSNIEVKLTPSPAKKGRRKISPAPNESFDLTDGSFEITPRARRAATAVGTSKNWEVVEISQADDTSSSRDTSLVTDSSQNDSEVTNRGTRKSQRTRGGKNKTPPAPKPQLPKATKQPKKMSYKQALALINAPIPEMPKTPIAAPTKEVSPAKPVAPAAARKAPRTYDIDLTGDVAMTEIHSTAPLFQKQANANPQAELVESDDDIDFDMFRVKVKLMDVIKAYPLRRHQRFYDLFKVIAEQNSLQMSNMFVFDGEKRIHPDDTPHSVNCKISTILLCRLMETKATAFKQTVKEHQIELKFQSDKWKKPISVQTSKLDDFKTAIAILCEHKQVPFKPEQFTLRFDGDIISLSETPMDLDFEGGEILDCGIKA